MTAGLAEEQPVEKSPEPGFPATEPCQANRFFFRFVGGFSWQAAGNIRWFPVGTLVSPAAAV
jgi:hypothetical protein